MQYLLDTDKIANGDILEVDANHKWGRELRLVNGIYCGKLLELSIPDTPGSLHYHIDKTESFVVLSGVVCIKTPDHAVQEALYHAGSVLTLRPYGKASVLRCRASCAVIRGIYTTCRH